MFDKKRMVEDIGSETAIFSESEFNNRILIVDDNEAIHDDFNKALHLSSEKNTEIDELEKALGGKVKQMVKFPTFKIDSAYQGEEALEMVKKSLAANKPYALTFVDIRMPPGWDGVETIEAIWRVDKNIQTIICTAHSDYSWEEIFERLGHSDRLLILKKPFDLVEIRLSALALTKKWMLNQQANLKLNELEGMVEKQTDKLVENLSLMEATLESTADGIIAIDMKNNILNYNKKFLEMWKIPSEIMENNDIKSVREVIQEKISKPKQISLDSQKDKDLLGSYREMLLKNSKYVEQFVQAQYREEEVIGFVYSYRDVTQRKRLEEELAKQGNYDHLTGLPNRLLLVDRIQHAIYYAKRNKTHVAILFIDLDSFKLINDSFGHNIGDELLKIFAQRLKLCMRESDSIIHLEKTINGDTAARLGGDEFVVVLTTNVNKKDEILPAVQRLSDILSQPYHLAQHELIVTFSTGISFYPEDGEDPISLIKNADYAMYRVKESKKGSYEFYSKEMDEKSLARLELENELRQALVKNELFLYYQPLFDIENTRLNSLEVLLRWNHPRLGLIPPATFIPVAESTGLIIPIGVWLLRTACKQNKMWQDSGLLQVPVSINLSGIQFKQKNIVEDIKEILDETGLEAKYLELELTENIIMRDNKDVTMKIQKLKELGIKVDIDDFGTGYSSLSYINQFPVDKIKIDHSFIHKITESRESQAIVQAILMIAKALKMSVVAEGVETEAQLDILKSISTDMVQGYFFSHPLSLEDTTKILKDHKDKI